MSQCAPTVHVTGGAHLCQRGSLRAKDTVMTRICIEVDGDGTVGPQVRTFSTVVGDGSQSDFAIDHNLNSQAVHVIAWDANTGVQRDDFTTVFTNANRATVTFDTPPAQNGVKVQVIAVIPAP